MQVEWAADAVFYHIYPLGLTGAPFNNNFGEQPVERLSKISGWIPHLTRLGINALYLGPLFESTSHGYDTADYYTVDRRLGTNSTLRNLIKEFHNNGIKIVLDGVFNHVGKNFFAFQDVIKNRHHSQYINWFSGITFSGENKISYDTWNGYSDLVKLNYDNKELIKYILDVVKFWIEYFEIDGLRLDVADCLDKTFQRELSAFCKNIRKDFWLMGEVIHGDYRNWVNPGMLDSVTNYECYKGLYSSHADKNFFEIAYSLNRLFGDQGIYRNLNLYNFADNHDVDRVIESLGNPYYLYTLYILLFTIPGTPSVYYGSEFGIGGKRSSTDDKELRPSLDIKMLTQDPAHPALLNLIIKLSTLKKQTEALISGSYREVYLQHRQFVFERKSGNQIVFIAINSDEKEKVIDISAEGKFIDELSGEVFESNKNNLKIKLWPNWGRILRNI